MTDFTIRQAAADDCEAVAAMLNDMNRLHGLPDDLFNAEGLRADGFAERPVFDLFVAEKAGRLVGYTLFVDFYDTDLAARGVWLTDVYVEAVARGAGIGRALIAAVAREAKARGGRSVWWGVDASNSGARALYARLGARDEDARILQLDSTAFDDLAAEASIGENSTTQEHPP